MSLLGTVGTLSLVILFYVLARLSERFGTVVKMEPAYRYYYLALLLAVISTIIHLYTASADPTALPPWFTADWFLVLTYYLPLAVAVTLSLYVTWYYWSWLITEHND
jgi:hypothetical protein